MASGDLSRIRTNIGALRALESINAQLAATNLRLATGKRIDSAGDDPAGLNLANTLDLRARRVAAAERNVADAENVISVVEAGLGKINDLLSNIMEKLVLAANDTQGVSERNAIMQEIQQLGAEIDSVVRQTQFSGVTLLTVNSAALLVSTLTVGSQALASASMATLQIAINTIRGLLQQAGSAIERLRVRADNLSTAELNLRAAQSRIMDADLAAEQLTASTQQILQQTATAQLAAANTAPAAVPTLFRG